MLMNLLGPVVIQIGDVVSPAFQFVGTKRDDQRSIAGLRWMVLDGIFPGILWCVSQIRFYLASIHNLRFDQLLQIFRVVPVVIDRVQSRREFNSLNRLFCREDQTTCALGFPLRNEVVVDDLDAVDFDFSSSCVSFVSRGWVISADLAWNDVGSSFGT